MSQQSLFNVIPEDKYDHLSKKDVVCLHKEEERLRVKYQRESERLRKMLNLAEEKSLFVNEQYISIKNSIFGKKSEKSEKKKKTKKSGEDRSKKRVRRPSLRYPNLPIIEQIIEFEKELRCKNCNIKMKKIDSSEDSEVIDVIPAIARILKIMKAKYKCPCCQSKNFVTAPTPPRIAPGSSFSDRMIIDVVISKYLDLMPIERYASKLSRYGLENLPPQTLIGLTHHAANFFEKASLLVKGEVCISKTVKADETPHKMLEGDKTKNWYLWAFSNPTSCYFEIQNTRSGDIVIDLLKKSKCENIITDDHGGYTRATREINIYRMKEKLPLIKHFLCNAHSRRKFIDGEKRFPQEVSFFRFCYKRIYYLNKSFKKNLKIPPDLTKGKVQRWQKIYYRAMIKKCSEIKTSISTKSKLYEAIQYFESNFDKLIGFVDHLEVDIDNNSTERSLRSPVVGRKIWYGTHSKRGAKTAAVLFTLVESCKLNKVDPYIYFTKLTESLHAGKEPFSPFQFSQF